MNSTYSMKRLTIAMLLTYSEGYYDVLKHIRLIGGSKRRVVGQNGIFRKREGERRTGN